MTIYSYYKKSSDIIKIQNALEDGKIKDFIAKWSENLYNKQFYKKFNNIAKKYDVYFFIDENNEKCVLVTV